MRIIMLDFGSGNTCQNNKKIVKQMYDELIAINNKKYYIIVKWQLFQEAGDNVPLDHNIFQYAYEYGTENGFEVISSVFDIKSLEFYLSFYVSFDIKSIKIANNPKSYNLIQYIPNYKHIFISYATKIPIIKHSCTSLCCISNYPAKYDDYVKTFSKTELNSGISDHTSCNTLFFEYKPKIIEWHYKLPNSTGLDAGTFARTPDQLSKIL